MVGAGRLDCRCVELVRLIRFREDGKGVIGYMRLWLFSLYKKVLACAFHVGCCSGRLCVGHVSTVLLW